jgi:hypothetical protein
MGRNYFAYYLSLLNGEQVISYYDWQFLASGLVAFCDAFANPSAVLPTSHTAISEVGRIYAVFCNYKRTWKRVSFVGIDLIY